jgi:hypothetical protein
VAILGDYHDGATLERPDAGHDGIVVLPTPVAMKLEDIVKHMIGEVAPGRARRMSRELNRLPH